MCVYIYIYIYTLCAHMAACMLSHVILFTYHASSTMVHLDSYIVCRIVIHVASYCITTQLISTYNIAYYRITSHHIASYIIIIKHITPCHVI